MALSIQPNISKFLVSRLSNGKDHFGLIRPEYSGPALMMVLFDQFSHFSWLDQNVPSHLRKLLSPVPLFCILPARTIFTKCVVAQLGRVFSTGMYCSTVHVKLQIGILLNGKCPWTRDFWEQIQLAVGAGVGGLATLTPFQNWMLYNLLETVVTCFHPPNWHFPLSGSHKTFHFSYMKFLYLLKFLFIKV